MPRTDSRREVTDLLCSRRQRRARKMAQASAKICEQIEAAEKERVVIVPQCEQFGKDAKAAFAKEN